MEQVQAQKDKPRNGGLEKFAFDDEPINIGDIVVFTCTGHMGKGRVLATDIPGIFGCVLVGSLIEKSRTALVLAGNCAVFDKKEVKA